LNSDYIQRERYFEHDADIGVIGYGATIEEAFEAAARATFAIMTDIGQVRDLESVTIAFEEPVELDEVLVGGAQWACRARIWNGRRT
jgi:SHS2 domain-containing protein